MASKYDWDFIRPLDQTSSIAALAQGNQQIQAGLQGVGNAVTGYADAMRQQNTDAILNTLMGAQTSADLPNTMDAVRALQQQYGRGYDQTAVRNAIDNRGATLAQRDLQAIGLQQAQAAQAAIPQLNASAIAQAKARGVNIAPLEALAALGIDTTGQINSFANNAVSDTRYSAETAERKANRAEDVAWRKSQAAQSQQNWQADFDYREDESNWNRGGQIAAENPQGSTLSFDGKNWTTTTTPGISRIDAYGALSGVRGVRNNNPGNLGFAGQKGASRENGSGRFAAFKTPEEGLAAMSKQLDLFYTGKSKNVSGPAQTVQAIIHAWAPPHENNTAAYINQVSKALGVRPDQKLNLDDPTVKSALMREIVKKENGGNPYSQAQYLAGISGKVGTAAAAANAVSIPQSVAATAVSNYNNSITELQNKFNLQTTKDQAKTGLGTKGQTIDSWLVSKATSDREGSTLFTNYSTKVAKLARNNAKLSNLPMDDQLKILDASHAWALAPGGVITDKELDKHITNLSNRLIDGRKAELEQGKKNIFETQYQEFTSKLNASGMPAIPREAFKSLVSPSAVQTSPSKSLVTQVIKAVQPETKQEQSVRRGVPPLLSNARNVRAKNEAETNERARNVANMPTQAEFQALKAKAKAKADAAAKAEDLKAKREAETAYRKLEEERKRKNHTLSPQLKTILNEFGGGILR